LTKKVGSPWEGFSVAPGKARQILRTLCFCRALSKTIDPLKLSTKTQSSHTFFVFAKEDEFAGLERKAGEGVKKSKQLIRRLVDQGAKKR
jgi:hypothetical protein